jgi:hypothetical protein
MPTTPTVRLVHRSSLEFIEQVEADVATAEVAFEQWLAGQTDASPQLADVAALRRLVRLRQSIGDDYDQSRYYDEIHDLAAQRLAAVTPAAATVGQLIDRLRGFDPDAPIELVVDGEHGRLDCIEVAPLT